MLSALWKAEGPCVEPWNKRSRMLPRRVSTLPTAAPPPRGATAPRPPALASVACGRRRALSAAPAAAASLQQLHDGILQGFAGFQFPSNDRFAELASRATTAEEAQLVVSAHRQFVDYQRIIQAHVDALVDACCRAGDWELLVATLRDSRKLQLFFRGTAPVKRAFDALAGGEAWEELEAAHAALPVMALDWVDSTSQLHSAAIAQLADGGELAAAARALDRALGMAAASPSKHRVRPGLTVKLRGELTASDLDARAPFRTLSKKRSPLSDDGAVRACINRVCAAASAVRGRRPRRTVARRRATGGAAGGIISRVSCVLCPDLSRTHKVRSRYIVNSSLEAPLLASTCISPFMIPNWDGDGRTAGTWTASVLAGGMVNNISS